MATSYKSLVSLPMKDHVVVMLISLVVLVVASIICTEEMAVRYLLLVVELWVVTKLMILEAT